MNRVARKDLRLTIAALRASRTRLIRTERNHTTEPALKLAMEMSLARLNKTIRELEQLAAGGDEVQVSA